MDWSYELSVKFTQKSHYNAVAGVLNSPRERSLSSATSVTVKHFGRSSTEKSYFCEPNLHKLPAPARAIYRLQRREPRAERPRNVPAFAVRDRVYRSGNRAVLSRP